MKLKLTLFAFLASTLCVSAAPPITFLGLNTNDTIKPSFWQQQSNANKTITGLNSNATVPLGTNLLPGYLSRWATNDPSSIGAGSGGASALGVLYVAKNGADTNTGGIFDPFLTIAAAADEATGNASSTQRWTVVVNAGTYDETDLVRPNVDFFFLPGAVVKYTGESAVAIFDDYVGAMKLTVAGSGTFTNYDAAELSRPVLVGQVTNPASYINFTANKVSCGPFGSGNFSAFNLVDGSGDFDIDTFGGGGGDLFNFFYWTAGEWRAQIKNMEGESTSENAVWNPSVDGVTGNFFLTCPRIDVGYSVLYGGDSSSVTNPLQKTWITTMDGIGVVSAFNSHSGRNYLTAQKLSGGNSVVQGGEMWATIQKLSLESVLLLSGGVSDLFIQEFQDLSSTRIESTGGTHIMTGDKIITLAQGAVWHSGGSLTLKNYLIDSSATTNPPIFVSGSGLILHGVSIVASNTVESVSATNAQTVTIVGTVTANTEPSTNVTFTGGEFLIGAAPSGTSIKVRDAKGVSRWEAYP